MSGDPVREEMLATWTEDARRRVPEAIRQAWTIVVTVNPQNEVQGFRVTVGSDPLFATVKADRRARVQDRSETSSCRRERCVSAAAVA